MRTLVKGGAGFIGPSHSCESMRRLGFVARHGEEFAVLVKFADDALHRAEEIGRRRAIRASELPKP